MKTKLLSLILASTAPAVAMAADAPVILMAPPAAGLPAVVRQETPGQHDARLQWFREARFGLFIRLQRRPSSRVAPRHCWIRMNIEQ